MFMNKLFREWFDDELKQRGWSIREFGRQSGIAPGDLSNMLNSKAPLSFRFFLEVSKVFGASLDWMAQIEGLLPSITDDTKIYSKLTPEKRQQVLDFAEFLLQKQQQETVPNDRLA
jgi:transcriptional regulator with XRE-family HTH domain